jgi:eukaryotic-like serine/threonine-protein kinase
MSLALPMTLSSERDRSIPEHLSMKLTQAFDGSAYEPIARIGGGAMGDVWEVKHRELGTHFAAKLIGIHHADDTRYIDRLRAEARALSKLDHPNLVRVTDLARARDGRWFFVMELLRGMDLAERLGEGTQLPVETAVAIVLQMLEGLGAAHAIGLVHRDVKPANVFLCRPARAGDAEVVKLVDFGVAKHDPASGAMPIPPTAAGAVVGTPRYMAPEQCAARPVDHRADLYAAGMVLFRALCGRTPFDEHHGVMALMTAQVRETPSKPSSYRPDLPPLLDAVILRTLAKRADDRYGSAEELAAALRPFLRASADDGATGPSLEWPATAADSPGGRRRAGAVAITEKMSEALALHRPRKTELLEDPGGGTDKMTAPIELRHKKTEPLPIQTDVAPAGPGRGPGVVVPLVIESEARTAPLPRRPARGWSYPAPASRFQAVLIALAIAAALLLLVTRLGTCGA